MIVTINWSVFHSVYYNQGVIYCKEYDSFYEFWTSAGMFFIRSVVEKVEDQSENIMFVERYISGRDNLIKADHIEEGHFPVMPQPSESSAAIRETEEEPEELKEAEVCEEVQVYPTTRGTRQSSGSEIKSTEEEDADK